MFARHRVFFLAPAARKQSNASWPITIDSPRPSHPPAPKIQPQTRGNQRELDRAKAAKLSAKHAGPPVREGTVQSRNEKDAAALKLKLERKAAEAAAAAEAAGGGGGGGVVKKK